MLFKVIWHWTYGKGPLRFGGQKLMFKKTQLHFPLYLFQHMHTICVDQSSVDEMYNIFLGKLFSGKTVHESFMVMDETSQTCHRQIFNGITPY